MGCGVNRFSEKFGLLTKDLAENGYPPSDNEL